MSDVERVVGKNITIVFEGARCIHSRGCVLGRPDVFVPNVEGEWIHPDAATVDEVRELAHNCPSGAIRYEARSGVDAEPAPVVNTVRIRENGPLAFHAPLAIDGKDEGFRATLCRCGLSNNKPYCDTRHHEGGFTATGEPEPKSAAGAAPARRDGPVAIEQLANGPLHVKGSLEIVSGTGRTIARATEAWLCRCGQSANKPYCDGSHKRVGFEAPGNVRG